VDYCGGRLVMMTSEKIDFVKKTLAYLDTFLKECRLAGYRVGEGFEDLESDSPLICTASSEEYAVRVYWECDLRLYSVVSFRASDYIETELWVLSAEELPDVISQVLRGERYGSNQDGQA
jgi:hypothetical protein